MVIWGAFVGLLFGSLAGLPLGWLSGAAFGGLAGYWLRTLVRREIAAAMEQSAPVAATAPPEVQTVPAVSTDAAAEVGQRLSLLGAFIVGLSGGRPASAGSHGPQEPPPVQEPWTATAEEWRLSAADQESDWLSSAKKWLLGGNTIVRTGLVILFVGLTFLASYAASHGYFPIELRLALVGAVGAVLVGIGFSKRDQRPMFARALEGTGVAVLYLTVFASARLYELIPLLPAFGLMILFSVFGCALAIMQNSQPMALAAIIGGFAVPVLLGGNAQQPFVPFSYYTILNLAILGIAWRRSWRLLNLVGFFATFGMAWVWGLQNYDPSLYAVCQSFLAASVLIYLATAVLYAHNAPSKLGSVVDGVLLFGPALAGFSLQVGLVRPYEFGSAYSSLVFGAVYIGIAAAIVWRGKATMRPLVDYLIAIGVGFVTLAIPLALSVSWTAAGWAIEGAVAFWIGVRHNRWTARAFGLALQAVGALIFLATFTTVVSAVPLANAGFIGALLIGVPLLATAWWLRRPMPVATSPADEVYRTVEDGMEKPFFLAGFVFVCLAFIIEFSRVLDTSIAGTPPQAAYPENLQPLLSLLAVIVLMWFSAQVGMRRSWSVARWPGQIAALVLWLVFLLEVSEGGHVLYTPNWPLWLLALVINFDLLFLSDRTIDKKQERESSTVKKAMHVASIWLVAAFLADSLQLGVDRAALWQTSWSGIVFLVSGISILASLTWWAGADPSSTAGRLTRWPLKEYAQTYYWTAAAPVAILVYFGALLTALFASGVTEPLPYVPLLNPVDLSVGLAFVILLLWRRAILRAGADLESSDIFERGKVVIALAVLGFAEVNGVWLRTAHHWLGVDWSPSSLSESFVVQAGLSILWTTLAMGLMIFAHRRLFRPLWFGGATLLAAVVAKLVLVDLSNVGGWERIVSYIIVGALMLVIGYFAPLPPLARQQRQGESAA